ncbi:MAG: ArsB/NhaD family transporter [archaeon]|nr:ArsB/NhaD family transporter [archaeon]
MNTASIAVSLIFVATIILIVKRPTIPLTIPIIGGKKINYWIASLIGAILIRIFGLISPIDVWSSIIGKQEYRPIGILILFLSLAFMAFALDTTGFFEYWALKALKAANGSGIKLFFFFYVVVSGLTIITSNDVVILVMTPFIYYSVKNAKLNLVPFLIAEFFAANTWSMMLLTGNPTNIIVAESFRLEFIEYLRWMFLPAIVGGIVNLSIIYTIFRKDIKNYSLELKEPEIRNTPGAIFVFSFLAMCLLGLAFATYIGWQLWMISLGFALLCGIFMLFSPFESPKNEIEKQISKKERIRESGIAIAVKRIPWGIAPYILSLFVLVEALKVQGIIDIFASTLFHAAGNNLVMGVFITGFGSVFSCNLINNIPMTITFVKILQNPLFMTMQNVEGLRYALCMGSNLGANITPLGALAGIMWLSILRGKGGEEIERDITKKFIKYGIFTTILVTLVSSTMLAIEVLVGW